MAACMNPEKTLIIFTPNINLWSNPSVCLTGASKDTINLFMGNFYWFSHSLLPAQKEQHWKNIGVFFLK
jgi:hypothetical protein